MKKITRFFAGVFAAFIVIAGMLPAVQVKAEETVKRTYTVTFRAGNVGRFQTETNSVNYENVEVTANYIKFTVEKGQSLGSTFDFISDDASLDAFFLNITDDIDEGYRLKGASDWCSGAASAVVNRNAEYVLDYAKLVNPVKYVISFVDVASGEQIAPPTIAYGNAGEELVCNPLAISSYDTEDEAVKLVLDAENEAANNVTFRYTYSGETGTTVQTVTEYAPGGTVVNTVVDEVEEETPAAAAVVTPVADDAQEDNVTIEDEEVPLGNEGEQADASEDNLVDIEDEEVPLAVEEEQSAEFYWEAVAGGAVAVIAGGAAAAVLVRKKRKSVVNRSNSDK